MPVVAVFAGNHGVVGQGVAAYPQAVTAQMVANFQAGGAAVNQVCKVHGLGLKVFELALDRPTEDITEDAALSEVDCAGTMAYGMQAIAGGCDLLCIGEMGIGNTTIAAAICHGLYGGAAADWAGPGTGLDAAGVRRKAEVVAAVRGGLLSLDDALAKYRLTAEEFLAWQKAIDKWGMQGLRTTRIQSYRS